MTSLIRPIPLPEELDRGYLGRVMRFNALGTEEEVLERVPRLFLSKPASRRDRPPMELLSLIAGQSMEQFTQRHSTIPLTRAIARTHAGFAHGSPRLRCILYRRGIGSARSGAYLCSECALADVGFHGVSYWRRELQVPGQLWCPKHMIPLHFLRDEAAFLQSPSLCLKQADAVQKRDADKAMKHPLIAKAMDIVSGLMTRSAALDSAIVGLVLRVRASEVGFRTHRRKGEEQLLMDHLYNVYPKDWLNMLFEESAGEKNCRVSGMGNAVDFPGSSAPSVWPYILVAAVLYGSADEAMNALSGSANLGEAREEIQSFPCLETESPLAHRIGDTEDRIRSCGTRDQTLSGLYNQEFKNLGQSRSPATARHHAIEAFYLKGKSVIESATASGLSVSEMEDLIRSTGADLALAQLRHGERSKRSEPEIGRHNVAA